MLFQQSLLVDRSGRGSWEGKKKAKWWEKGLKGAWGGEGGGWWGRGVGGGKWEKKVVRGRRVRCEGGRNMEEEGGEW